MTDEATTVFNTDRGMLHANAPRYRAVMELTSDCIYCMRMDPNGAAAVEWVTDAFLRLTGYTLEELYARGGWIVLVHPDDLQIVLKRSRELMQGQEVENIYRIVTKGGETRWVRDVSRPEWDADHERVLRIYGAMQDITAFKQQELNSRIEAQSFQTLFALYPQPMWIYDVTSLQFLEVNEAACALYGYTREDFLKMTLADLRMPEVVPTLRANVSALSPVSMERWCGIARAMVVCCLWRPPRMPSISAGGGHGTSWRMMSPRA